MGSDGRGKQSRESTSKKDEGGSRWEELLKILPFRVRLEDKYYQMALNIQK
jgi:hypothetical protein